MIMLRKSRVLAGVLFVLVGGGTVLAQATDPAPAATANPVDVAWVLVTAGLVFFMQAGFGALEVGLVRAKNACNIMMKNFLDFCISALAYLVVGYAIMYGVGNAFFGQSGWCLSGLPAEVNGLPLSVYWLFQVVFCGTAATIVSGSVAERMRFPAYLSYSLLISILVYPVVGHWVWGGGWLMSMGMKDFAGSGVVHAVGGFAGLVGAILLGPRLDKFGPDGRPRVLAGHNIPIAGLGVFILWFGWYGFNPGSTLGLTGANGALAGTVAINTTLAAAVGGLTSMLVVWRFFGKPDLTMTMNGLLAGLVAITAPCAGVSHGSAILIGAVGGTLVVGGVVLLERLHIDDPVGAWPVHGLNGVWGVLSVGLFDREGGLLTAGKGELLGVQTVGAAAIILWTMVVMLIVFKLIDVVIGLRVSNQEEMRGLDIGEHGMEAYAGFEIFVTT